MIDTQIQKKNEKQLMDDNIQGRDSDIAQPMIQVKVSNVEQEKSKRVFIGMGFLSVGFLTTISIIIAAAINVPGTTEWLRSYPSKLWFLIFEGNGIFLDSPKGLGLGPFFIIGILLFVVGVVMLLWEYFYKTKKEEKDRI